MSVQVTSTTDNEEAVTKAMGLAAESKENEKPEGQAPEKVELEDKAEETDSTEDSEENKEVEESKDEESSEEESEDSETSEEEEGEDEEDAGEKKKPRRRRAGYKRRVQKLSKKLSEAESEAKYWREQALKNQGEAKDAGAESQESKKESSATANDRPSPGDFENPEDFVEALADWKFEQKMKATEAEKGLNAQQKELEKKAQKLQKQVQEFSLKHDDFEELIEDINHIPVSPTIQEALLESENGAALMYELAKRPEEYEKINGLPPVKAATALGRFEAKYVSPSSDEPEQTVKKKTTAPKPLSPVKSKGSNTSTKSPDEMSYQEYKEWRAKQLKKRF